MTIEQRPDTRPVTTFQEIITNARQWEAEHEPFDRTSRMNLFQYIIEEGQGGALVPFQVPSNGRSIPTIYLRDHAHGQLLARLDYTKKLYERLPAKLNILALNWLIQNHYEKDVLLRIQDGNQARALLSAQFEPFCQDAAVKWYFSDEMTLHVSITWPKTQEEVTVGDIVQRGIHISNSELGVRSVTVAGYLYRLKCRNGMVGGGEGGGIRRFRHVGDTDKLRDMVAASIEETFLESQKMLTQFKASLEKAVEDPYNYLERVAKDKTNDMTQEQFKAAMDAFMLEPNNNLYAVTNAITRAAQGFEGEDKFDLERLGAKVLAEGLQSRS